MTIEVVLLLIFFTALISGCTVLLLQFSSSALKLILSFSGAYLLALTVLHIIPEIYNSTPPSLYTELGIFILSGFLLQIFIEYFSEGIEHGHIHIHKHEEKHFPLTVMLALSVHSFLEGMPLAGNWNETKKALATGIILHNIPIAIALTTMLLQSAQKKINSIAYLVIFALMTPLGAMAGNFMERDLGLLTNYSNCIMAIVVGIFLHISTTILFESSEQHRFHLLKLIVILLGMGLAFAI
jgi:zinc transporter ZupT